MKKLLMSAGAVVIVGVAALAGATPSYALFGPYQDEGPPPAGDCERIAARIGPDATWYGEFAGNFYDDFRDQRYPYSARGCFRNEFECRRWTNESMTYTGRGGMLYARCTRGVPGGY